VTAGRRAGQAPTRIAVAVLGASFLLLGSAGCTRRERPEREQAAPEPAARLEVIQIPVEGMSCAVCASRVRAKLTSIDGVREADVSLVERRARVRFDPGRVSPEELVTAIESVGYRAGLPEGLR